MGHILIIDRDISAAHPLTQALTSQGHTLSYLAAGADAVAVAKARRPDVVLLSVELPGASGYAICNRLKKDDELHGVPLLLASSEATDEVFAEHRRLKTHADGYVHKPYQTEQVLGALAALLVSDQSTQVAEGARPPSAHEAQSFAPSTQDPLAPQGEAGSESHDPLMSTAALLLLEGSVDVNKHTQVIRLPVGVRGAEAKDLIGAALADLDSDAVAALQALEERVMALEQVVRRQGEWLTQQEARCQELLMSMQRMEQRQSDRMAHLDNALHQSAQLCRDALLEPRKTP